MPAISDIKPHSLGVQQPSPTGSLGKGSQEASFATTLSLALSQTPETRFSSHPRHLPLPDKNHAADGFHERALGIRAYRQQLIASNIANADTPNYKAVDIDLKNAMQGALTEKSPALTLMTTSSLHTPGKTLQSISGMSASYHLPSQASADGNTVDMDVERAKFAENSVMYEFSLQRASQKDILELLANLK